MEHWSKNGGGDMTLCKGLRYYVVAMGKKYSFGRVTGDYLEARVTLDRARRAYPGEVWGIVTYAA